MPSSSTKRTISPRGEYARSEGTRARILEAALAEAGESCFQNTSVAKIAARADVAVGILNYHFGSKQGLLRQLMESQAGEFLSRVHPPAEHDTFFSYEEAILAIYLDFLQTNPNYVRLAEEVRLHDPELYRQGTQAHVEHIEGRIKSGIARGDLQEMSDTRIRDNAYFMLGTMTFLDRYLEDTRYPDNTSVVASYISFIRGGLAP